MAEERVSVVEPTRTRNIQIVICASFVTTLVVLRCLPSTDDPSPAGFICPPIGLFTLIHHLTIIVLAFRQRRKLYSPDEVANLVPVTAKTGAVLSSWTFCCLWLVTSMFYFMDLGRPRHKTLFFLTGVETALVFGISAMCSRERLELLERQAEQPTSLVFLVDENGDPVAMEGP